MAPTLRFVLLVGTLWTGAGWVLGDPPPPGEAIYRKLCASCHGAQGEGTKEEYPHPLAGQRSLADLSRLVDQTMPADDPDLCKGKEAEQVAAYVYENFYSPLAQARNKPARVELARLTVRQHQNAVADLLAGPRAWGTIDDKRGLRGEYFKGRRFNRADRLLERTDPGVRFDFGTSAPAPGIVAAEFAIRWQGSLLASDSGEYELIVRTPNAVRLWLNDSRRALIDAGVKSGDQTEYRQSIRLLGGRAYPLRLEFQKGKEKSAAITLAWKPPQQTEEPIPVRQLSPQPVSPTFVLTTPFPPDDRSVGYERGTAISKAWEEAATQAAIEVAGEMTARLAEVSGVGEGGGDRAGRLRQFCRQFVETAFRRPLDKPLEERYLDRPFRSAPDPETGVKRVVLLALTSPRFLYREVDGPADYQAAARLSFALWDTIPDRPLLEAASRGELRRREAVVRQAERMMADRRAQVKLRSFFLDWLKVAAAPDLSKDRQFAGFDAQIASDLRTSLDLLLDEVLSSPAADFRQLLLADRVYFNGRLAKYYGAKLAEDAPFQPIAWESDRRAGVLSHPYLMAGFAYTASSSPIHRGVFLARSVLGRSLRPPPEAVAPLAPDLHPGLTTRQRVSLQTSPAACQTCHTLINPLGFALEHFDATGRYRAQEQGRAIDATGAYQTRDGGTVQFSGARPLAQFLAASEETHSALVEQLFQYTVKQPIRAYGANTLGELRRRWVQSDFNLRKLMVEAAVISAMGREEP